MRHNPTTIPGDEEQGASNPQQPAPEEIAEHVLAKVLTTVIWSLAESQGAGQTLDQAVEKLYAVLRADYGIDTETLVSLTAREALRRMNSPLGRLQRGLDV